VKRSIIITLIFVLSCSIVYGQKASTEDTLKTIEQAICDSIVSRKTADFEKYVSDTAYFTDPGGMAYTKKDVIGLLVSGTLKFESSVHADMKIMVVGDTAVVTYNTLDKGTFGVRDISGKYRWTDTFVKIKGKWTLIAAHGTPVAPME
jgi:ketosteroid isomerase-like protein